MCLCVCVHRRQQRGAEAAEEDEVLGHVNVVALQLQHGADKGVDGVWIFVALEALVDISGRTAHSGIIEHVVRPRVQRDGLDLGAGEFATLDTLELVEFSEVMKRVKRGKQACQKRPSIGVKNYYHWRVCV